MALCRVLCTTLLLVVFSAHAQLPVARENITVFRNGAQLSMPWGGGINSANVSNIDLNNDGLQDLVLFDQQDNYRHGIFRCFLFDGQPGQVKFRNDPGLSYYFPQLYFWAVLHDYNKDGRADLFASTAGGIRVFRNITPAGGLPAFELATPLLHSDYFPSAPSNTPTNLYAGTSGPAGITDVDGDGDLDILTFSPLGIYLELHRNMSRELYGHSDSLVFQREDECWGDLAESSCSVDFEVCSGRHAGPSKELHAGSCIACLDNDGDNDIDLIMGDVSCDFVNYVNNGGTPGVADFNDTTQLFPNFPQKNDGSTVIRLSYFPCVYPVDADSDGKTDLIATPNVVAGENAKSVWLYRNTGSGPAADFKLEKKDFLQDQMIDVGEGSYPVLMDVDADGKKDLLIGTRGIFSQGKFSSALNLYRNVGSLTVPVFSFVTADFAGISSHSLNAVIPAPGDIDGDGDEDICIGTSGGQVHWLENTAGAGKPFTPAPLKISPFGFTTPSARAAPQVFDLDNDGRADLLIGMRNGSVAYYRNTGSTGSPTFSLVTSTLGGIDVKGDPAYFSNDGFAVPRFFREAGNTFALIGSVSGHMFLYQAPSPGAVFSIVSSAANALLEGAQSAPWYEDIDGDGKRDLFIGNATGGLSYFSSSSPHVGIAETTDGAPKLVCYPNPATSEIVISAGNELAGLVITDIAGREMWSATAVGLTDCRVDLSFFDPGIYYVTARVYRGDGLTRMVSRFIKK